MEAFEAIRDQYWLVVGICAFGLLVGTSVPIILTGPMFCGMHIALKAKVRGETIRFDTLFRGFDHLGRSSLALTWVTIVFLVVVTPLLVAPGFFFVQAALDGFRSAASVSNMILSLGVGSGILILAAAGLSTLFLFVLPLIADSEVRPVDALRLSVRAVQMNGRAVWLLLLGNSLLALLGTLACCVPIVLVLPIAQGAQAIAFERIFGFDQQN